MASHNEILAVIKKTDHLKAEGLHVTDEVLIRLLFSNVRYFNDGSPTLQLTYGLQLTHYGCLIVQKVFAHWKFLNPKGFEIKPKYLLFFDQTCTMPWYLNKDRLVLFEAQLAMRTKLVGNLDHLITAFQI